MLKAFCIWQMAGARWGSLTLCLRSVLCEGAKGQCVCQIPLGKTQVEPSLPALQESPLKFLLFFYKCSVFLQIIRPTQVITDFSAYFFPSLNWCAWFNLLLYTRSFSVLPDGGAGPADRALSAHYWKRRHVPHLQCLRNCIKFSLSLFF